MRIETFRYNAIPEEKHLQLKALLETAWSNQEASDVHPKKMDAKCFCAIIDEEIVGYVGLIRWTIFVEHESYGMCGLSQVCTHPAHQRYGIGRRPVNEVTQWVATAGIFDSMTLT